MPILSNKTCCHRNKCAILGKDHQIAGHGDALGAACRSSKIAFKIGSNTVTRRYLRRSDREALLRLNRIEDL